MADLVVEVGANTRKLTTGLKEAEGKLKGFGTRTESIMSGVATSIGGAFSIAAIGAFTKQVFNATAEFQKFGAVLGNTLGSASLANIQLQQIADFAAKTPFSINELTAAFVKLANAGFKPTGEQMTKLGDLASSTGKSFDQLAEAILDAQSGEFERLKEFGIRAKDAGDKVIFTYKGVQTQTEKTASAIRDYITALGGTEGVTGSMAVISETLTGKISNLGDAWDQMLVSVGSNTEGVFSGAISIIGEAIDKITEYNKIANTAGKYDIKATFSDRVQGLFSGQTALPVAKAETILFTGSEIAKQVAGYIEGAKSVNAFNEAIRALYDEGKRETKGLTDINYAKGLADQYAQGIRALVDAKANFLKKGAVTPEANFGTGKAAKKIGLTDAQRAELEQQKRFAEFKVEGNAFAGGLIIDGIKRNSEAEVAATKKAASDLENALEQEDPLAKVFQARSQATVDTLTSPFQNLKNVLQTDILPQLGDNFKTFFDEILIRGQLNFKSLGQAIKSTFASVLASEAANGILGLVTGGAGGAGKKGGGLFKALGGILGIGGSALGAGGAGGAGAAAAGTAATGGLLLPILGGLAAGGLIASLFKKKPQAAMQSMPTTSPMNSAGGYSGFNPAEFRFRIVGQDLVALYSQVTNNNKRFGP